MFVVRSTRTVRAGLFCLWAKMYVSFGGEVPPAAPRSVREDPPHLTPDAIRASYGRRPLPGQNERAEWAVVWSLFTNSYLSRWRYLWNRDDVLAAANMLAPAVVVRFRP